MMLVILKAVTLRYVVILAATIHPVCTGLGYYRVELLTSYSLRSGNAFERSNDGDRINCT